MQQQGAQQRFQRREAAQSPHRSAASAQLLPRGRKESNQYAPIFQLRHASSLEWPWSNVNLYLSAYAPLPPKFLVFMKMARFFAQTTERVGVTGKIIRTKELGGIISGWTEVLAGRWVKNRERT